MALKRYLRTGTTTETGYPTAAKSAAMTDVAGLGVFGLATSLTPGVAQASVSLTPPAQNENDIMASFVWGRLSVGGTIAAGNWTLSAAGDRAGSGVTTRVRFSVYVWRPSTTSVIGFIVDGTTQNLSDPETAFSTTLAGAAVSGTQAGDLVVCEVWAQDPNLGGGHTSVFYYNGTTEGSASSNAAYLLAPADVPLADDPATPIFLDASALGALQRNAFQENPVDQQPVGFQVDKAGVPQAFQPEAFQRNGAFQEIWTLAPTAIPTAESLGIARLERRLRATGIGTAESLGSAKIERVLRETGIPSGEVLGSARIERRIRATGITTSEAFGTARIERVLRVSGITTAETVGSARVERVLRATLIPSAESFGTGRLERVVRATGISTGELVGSARVERVLHATRIPSAESIGNHTLLATKLLLATGIPTGEAFGSGRIERIVKPAAIATGETVGSSRVVRVLGAQSIPTGEAFGSATIELLGAKILLATCIPSGESFGNATLIGGSQTVTFPPGGHGGPFGRGEGWSPPIPRPRGAVRSAESADRTASDPPAFATVRLFAGGVGSSESFGTATVTFGRNPRHIADEEALLVLI